MLSLGVFLRYLALVAAPRHFLLDAVEDVLGDNTLMIAGHIILRDFTVVLLALFGDEIHHIGLLQNGIAYVFLVSLCQVLHKK